MKFQVPLLVVELKALSLLKRWYVLFRARWAWDLVRGEWVLSPPHLRSHSISLGFTWRRLGKTNSESPACDPTSPWGQPACPAQQDPPWESCSILHSLPTSFSLNGRDLLCVIWHFVWQRRCPRPLPPPPASRIVSQTCANERELTKLQSRPSVLTCVEILQEGRGWEKERTFLS